MKTFILTFCLAITISSLAQVIPFTTNEEGNIVVTGKINDTVPIKLIFDTGGGLNIISNKFFQKIKSTAVFQHCYTGFRHDGDRIDLEIYKVPSLAIGSYKMRDALVGVTTILDEWNMDGIISLINFEKTPITIDYRQKKLNIETSSQVKEIAKTAQSLAIKLHQFANISLDIFVAVCINGKQSLDMEFDTGSLPEDILVNNKFMNTLGIDTLKTRNSTFITPFTRGSFRRYVAIIDSVQYCGLKKNSLKNIRVDFKENMIYEGVIGAGCFQNIPFTIDIPNKRILVQTK